MASEHVLELTAENWEAEVKNSSVPVLVDFWATWCGPCRALAPTVERIAGNYAGKLKVGKLNVEEHQPIAIRYNVSSLPTLLFFEAGNDEQPAGMMRGAQPESAIVNELSRFVSDQESQAS